MHQYQQRGWWSLTAASQLWLGGYPELRLRVTFWGGAHESTYSPYQYTTMDPLPSPYENAIHSTHAYLAYFRVSTFTCLWTMQGVQVSISEESGQMGSSVLGYVVHPCREVYLSIACPTVTDTRSCIPIDTTWTGCWGMIWICCFGSLERIPDRWYNNINMTYVILLYSLMLLQDGGF